MGEALKDKKFLPKPPRLIKPQLHAPLVKTRGGKLGIWCFCPSLATLCQTLSCSERQDRRVGCSHHQHRNQPTAPGAGLEADTGGTGGSCRQPGDTRAVCSPRLCPVPTGRSRGTGAETARQRTAPSPRQPPPREAFRGPDLGSTASAAAKFWA